MHIFYKLKILLCAQRDFCATCCRFSALERLSRLKLDSELFSLPDCHSQKVPFCHCAFSVEGKCTIEYLFCSCLVICLMEFPP